MFTESSSMIFNLSTKSRASCYVTTVTTAGELVALSSSQSIPDDTASVTVVDDAASISQVDDTTLVTLVDDDDTVVSEGLGKGPDASKDDLPVLMVTEHSDIGRDHKRVAERPYSNYDDKGDENNYNRKDRFYRDRSSTVPNIPKECFAEEPSTPLQNENSRPRLNLENKVSAQLTTLTEEIANYRVSATRIDTIRSLHQSLNQAKTLNLLLRQRLKEMRQECNVLVSNAAAFPPVDPLYQAVWSSGVFPHSTFVAQYRKFNQRIFMLYTQYSYRVGGTELEICQSHEFRLFLREYLGGFRNVRIK